VPTPKDPTVILHAVAEPPEGYRGRRRYFRFPLVRKAGGAVVPVLLITVSAVVVLVVIGVSSLVPGRSAARIPSASAPDTVPADTGQATGSPPGTAPAPSPSGTSTRPSRSAKPGASGPGAGGHPTPSPRPDPSPTSPPGAGAAIVNGGFESGTFTGWSRTGTTSIVSDPVRSGTRAVLLGSANPTDGDSAVSQTFTAPPGTSTVSFWYDLNCPDDVFWDWATAILADRTTGSTRTVLPRTCTLGAGWQQVAASVTPGHSYTLTLVSHDENNPRDATDTTYDDVTLS
jgi:hypothetical protein